MMEINRFPRGTPIGRIPPINDSERYAGPRGLTLVMGFHVPVMQSVSAERGLDLKWPCALLGYANSDGALIGILHRIDDVGAEVVLLNYGVQVTRALMRDALRQCAELESGGVQELRVRLPVSAHKLRCRARRYGFSFVESDGDEDIFSIATHAFCGLGRRRRSALQCQPPALQ